MGSLLFPRLRRWAALVGMLNLATALLLPSFAAAAAVGSPAAVKKPKCKAGYVAKQVKKRVKVKRGKKKVWKTKKVWSCVKAPDTQAPSAPGGIEVAAGEGSVTLVWNPSKDNVRVVAYRVLRDGQELRTADKLFFNDVALNNGTTYRYAIVALDAAGNASAPSSIEATPRELRDRQAPTPPTGLSAVAGDALVALAWGAASDNRAVSGYRILRNGAELTQLPASALVYTDATASNGTTYTYDVIALDAAGNYSTPASASATPQAPPDFEAPTAPAGVTAVPAGDAVAVSWQAASDNRAVTGYRVYRAASVDGEYSEVTASPASGISYSDAGLTNASYYYKVSAVDAAGNESAKSEAVATTVAAGGGDTTAPSIPGAPVAAGGQQQIQLDWTASSDDTAVSGYRIYVAASSDGTYTYLASAPSNTYLHTALAYNTTFYYKISAVDAAGNESGQSATVSAATVDTTAPNALVWSTSTEIGQQGIYEDAANHAVRLNWQMPIDIGGSGISSYRIYRWRSGICFAEASCTAPSSLEQYTLVKELSPGSLTTWLDCGTKSSCGTKEEPHGDLPLARKYYYYMTSLDGAGNVSAPSPEIATYVSPIS